MVVVKTPELKLGRIGESVKIGMTFWHDDTLNHGKREPTLKVHSTDFGRSLCVAFNDTSSLGNTVTL